MEGSHGGVPLRGPMEGPAKSSLRLVLASAIIRVGLLHEHVSPPIRAGDRIGPMVLFCSVEVERRTKQLLQLLAARQPKASRERGSPQRAVSRHVREQMPHAGLDAEAFVLGEGSQSLVSRHAARREPTHGKRSRRMNSLTDASGERSRQASFGPCEHSLLAVNPIGPRGHRHQPMAVFAIAGSSAMDAWRLRFQLS